MSVVLTINGGSSSVKFAAYEDGPTRLFKGQIDRIGSPESKWSVEFEDGRKEQQPVPAGDHAAAATFLLDRIVERLPGTEPAGIGHRVVHGGLHLTDHQIIADDVIAQLKQAVPIDAVHLPREIELIELCRERFPDVPQVVCFDTSFFRDLPRMAKLLPIPRRFDHAGVRRFGFHGLSYTYLMGELEKANAAGGRVVLAHLGSGASMAAVRDGKPIDTTMGFTPMAGLVMGTRPGDIDPGLIVYLLRTQKMSADELDRMFGTECGIKGVSETIGDIRDVTAKAATDVRAAEAVGLFVYRCRQHLGSLTAVLGGLDTLVFAGGIGEHAAEVRAAVCDGFGYLGLKLDGGRNGNHSDVISTAESRVTVRVIPTDEQHVIARTTLSLITRKN